MSSLNSRQVLPVPDNFAYVVPVDHSYHTEENPFCYDQTCPCHEDEDAIAAVNYSVQDGLLTPEEATDFTLGKVL